MGTAFPGQAQPRPSYIELDPTSSNPLDFGFDCVELKLDGQWGRLVVENGQWTVWSRHGQSKAGGATSETRRYELQGEFLFGSNWAGRRGIAGEFHAFDVTGLDGDLRRVSHQMRKRLLKSAVTALTARGFPLPLRFVQALPVNEWQRLWSESVERDGFEGLVFKKSTGVFGDTWGRMKREFTVDYVCLGANAGGGRYAGRAAASIQAGLMVSEQLVHVANVGGLGDELRSSLHLHPERFVGRVFEAKGKGLYETGGLRHPNFVRWRDDKMPSECVKPGGA